MRLLTLIAPALLVFSGCIDDTPVIKPIAPASKAGAAAMKADTPASKPAASVSKTNGGRPAIVRKKKPNKTVTNPKRISSLKRAPIEWSPAAGWMDWEAGLAAAKISKKPICLVLYADWCPRCKELAPVFESGEIAKLGKGMVMVRQNIDERPKWLEQFGSLGSYVPRVFFFDAEGNIMDDITSAHARYPYFYTPAGRKALETSMRKALEKT
ncbi:MAG: thiol-disulfide isomerase/thioredoxin [Bradymonadia bacterium]|jgi:thiol-disulfide isomerase/thioredoxin